MAEKSATAPVEQSKGRSTLLFLRDILVIFVVALLISFLVKTFLVRPFWIPSESMNDTLQVDDRIVVSLLTPEIFAIERGDVVVFEDPGGWLPTREEAPSDEGILGAIDAFFTFVGIAPEDDHNYLVKRVIGLPGDRVQCCNDFGQLLINDIAIDEPYLKLDSGETAASGVDFDVTLPDGQLWLLGDNRDHSGDSRAHLDAPGEGFVPLDSVVGRALVISWPVDRWTWLERYEDTFVGVEPQSSTVHEQQSFAVTA